MPNAFLSSVDGKEGELNFSVQFLPFQYVVFADPLIIVHLRLKRSRKIEKSLKNVSGDTTSIAVDDASLRTGAFVVAPVSF